MELLWILTLSGEPIILCLVLLIFGIEKLMIEANDGDKLSQYQLGICYKEGSAKFSSGKKIKSDMW